MNETTPTHALSEGLRPGRLWSLWDMFKHDSAIFYFHGTSLALSRAVLEIQIDSGTYREDAIVKFEVAHPLRRGLESVRQNLPPGCELAGMSIAALEARIAESAQPLKAGEITSALREIEGRIRDGLKSTFMLSLSAAESALFEHPSPFGEGVAQQFPGVVYETEEAAKCLALGRSTASAFHAIRCLESAIAALSRCLGIPDPTKASGRNWGELLRSVKSGIDAKWPTNSHKMHGDGEFFDNAYAALAAMQNPWRNATMHLDQKYTSEEAQHIFDVVKSFMTRVANRMDENGEPKV